MEKEQKTKSERYNYFHIGAQIAAATFKICTQPCYLKRIVLNRVTSGLVIRIVDEQQDVANNQPTCVADILLTTTNYPGQEILYEMKLSRGLTITTSGTAIDYTIIWGLEEMN